MTSWFTVALLASRLVLAGTFALAGTAKLASPATAAQAVAGFGAPAALAPLLLWLPVAEILVAIGLGFAISTVPAALAAAGLLILFIAAIAVNLARGRRPDCRCFGQIRPAPVSGLTILRNVALLALAGAVVAAGHPPAEHDLWVWFRALSGSAQIRAVLIAAALLVALRVWLPGDPEPESPVDDEDTAPPPAAAVQASASATGSAAATSVVGASVDAAPRRGPSAPASRLSGNGLPPGTPAPAFSLPDLGETTHTLADLLAGGLPLVLVFTSPGCESCQALVPRLPALAAAHAARLRLVLMSRDTVARNLAKLPEPGALLVLRQRDYEVAEAFDITSSPAALVVSTEGVVTSPLAMGGLAVLQLIADTAGAQAPEPPSDAPSAPPAEPG